MYEVQKVCCISLTSMSVSTVKIIHDRQMLKVFNGLDAALHVIIKKKYLKYSDSQT